MSLKAFCQKKKKTKKGQSCYKDPRVKCAQPGRGKRQPVKYSSSWLVTSFQEWYFSVCAFLCKTSKGWIPCGIYQISKAHMTGISLVFGRGLSLAQTYPSPMPPNGRNAGQIFRVTATWPLCGTSHYWRLLVRTFCHWTENKSKREGFNVLPCLTTGFKLNRLLNKNLDVNKI